MNVGDKVLAVPIEGNPQNIIFIPSMPNTSVSDLVTLFSIEEASENEVIILSAPVSTGDKGLVIPINGDKSNIVFVSGVSTNYTLSDDILHTHSDSNFFTGNAPAYTDSTTKIDGLIPDDGVTVRVSIDLRATGGTVYGHIRVGTAAQLVGKSGYRTILSENHSSSSWSTYTADGIINDGEYIVLVVRDVSGSATGYYMNMRVRGIVSGDPLTFTEFSRIDMGYPHPA